jgi:hypothetical protein
MTEIRTFPYRRDIRPPNTEGLGEHVDREFEKIEAAVALLLSQIADIQAQIDALTP